MLRRGYQIASIELEFDEVRSLSQIEFLNKPKRKPTSQAPNSRRLLPFIIPYDDKSKALSKALKNTGTSQKTSYLATYGPKKPFLVLKRHTNLQDMLVHSRFNEA